jgi:DNA-binding transcriptional LysR family regulator
MIEPRDLPLLAVFAAVVRCGSFTAAARELGLSKSVVSDQVRALEERCAVRLLERTTRSLRLTQVGEHVLGAATAVVAATRDVEAILEEHREAPVGTLRVATTHDLGPRFVAPVAAALAARYPELRVDIVADDAAHDLIAGSFDLAVRLGAPRDSGYVMRRLGTTVEPVVAAPALADRYPSASRPRDLNGAPWACHSLLARGDVMTFRGPRGEQEEIAVSVRAQANTGDGVRALLLAGVGFGALPEHLIAEDLQRGALVRVCPEWIWKQVTLYAVLPSAKRRPKRVTLFLAALKEALVSAGLPGG